MKIENKELFKNAWTIPNILTYIRILLVPVVMWLIIDKKTYIPVGGGFSFAIIALAVMAFAMFTDLIDGKIARAFNQVSELGKALDPVADKLMHTMTAVALCIALWDTLYFVVGALMVLKEFTMIILGILISSKKNAIQAVMIGKVASAWLSVAFFTGFFHDFWFQKGIYLDYILLGIGMVLSYIAFVYYATKAIPVLKEIFNGKKLAKNPDGNTGDSAVNNNTVDNSDNGGDND